MANYYRGETVVVTGQLTDSDGSGFLLSDLTTFEVVVYDSIGNSYSYSKAATTVTVGTDTSSYEFIITPAQSTVLKGVVYASITGTFVDATYSVTSTDKFVFEVGKFI